MDKKIKVIMFWFRRDLRLDDNVGLSRALSGGHPVIPLFIFDTTIIHKLPPNDARISFIYDTLQTMHQELETMGSGLLIKKGNPKEVWRALIQDHAIEAVYANRDYEPDAIQRDVEIQQLLASQGVTFHLFKDQVIFEPGQILKNNGQPYTIYTPYMKKWLSALMAENSLSERMPGRNFQKARYAEFPQLQDLGFRTSNIKVAEYNLSPQLLSHYDDARDFPDRGATTHLGPHLRYGTISIRQAVRIAKEESHVLLKELIWREFFMQILFFFPKVVDRSFKPAYDFIDWRNDEKEFRLWCTGATGYPIVDAGMRELNATGYMHNRIRMIVASFLSKHLLIDWRWGEAYFSDKLLDFELSSNNGNWQWAAGTGCDAAPYFRVFNPTLQQKKFDPNFIYISKWVPEFQSPAYPGPIVKHEDARDRAMDRYRNALEKKI